MYQLAISKQGTMEPLKYPMHKVDKDAYWVVFHKALIMVRKGWIFYWTSDMPGFEDSHLSAISLPDANASEVTNALLNEVAILQQLTKLL
jgi:hypothetical protein